MDPATIFTLKRTKGKGRGKDMGIPTLNFVIPKELSLPYGIYAGWVIDADKKYRSAIHFGPRPQFNEADPSLEAYILDGHVSDLPEKLQLQFISFIREIREFPTVKDMLKRIEEDIDEITKKLKI